MPSIAGRSYRYHSDLADHAGLGYPHRLVAWTDRAGTPRSVVIRPDADEALLESITIAIDEHDFGGMTQDAFWRYIAEWAGSHSLD